MKVLFVSSSIEEKNRFQHDQNCPYPLGLAYLYSFLEKNGYEIKLEFLNNFPYEYVEKKVISIIKDWKPDVVGFQIFSMTRVSTFKLVEKIHNDFSFIKIIIGGVHASIMYEQIVKKYPYTVAVIGEGEITTLELLQSYKNNTDINLVQGIAFFEQGNVIKTEPRNLISDLDILPFPKHEIFFNDGSNRNIAHIITSRGCPFNCSFCCLKIISKGKLRKRNINKVVEEIVYLKRKFPQLSHIQFHDDTFLIDNERVIEFCKLLINENLNITFECSARVKPIIREMFEWLEKAGCTKIMFGLETGSESLLKSIHKGILQKDVIDLFNLLKDFKFTVTTFLMCGFPGENVKTINETIKLVRRIQKIKYSWIAGVGKLWVYPGTEVYEKMKQAGCINDSFWLTDNDVPFYTVENSLKKLINMENKIMNGVSLERIFTVKGFFNHFMKMPGIIIKFLLKNPGHLKRLVANGSLIIKIPVYIFKQIKKIINFVFFKIIFRTIKKTILRKGIS